MASPVKLWRGARFYRAFLLEGTMDQLKVPLGESARYNVLSIGEADLERRIKVLKRKHKALARGDSAATRRANLAIEQAQDALEAARRLRNA
jgi:hypothetical protein